MLIFVDINYIETACTPQLADTFGCTKLVENMVETYFRCYCYFVIILLLLLLFRHSYSQE